jgi:hypothetical protein
MWTPATDGEKPHWSSGLKRYAPAEGVWREVDTDSTVLVAGDRLSFWAEWHGNPIYETRKWWVITVDEAHFCVDNEQTIDSDLGCADLIHGPGLSHWSLQFTLSAAAAAVPDKLIRVGMVDLEGYTQKLRARKTGTKAGTHPLGVPTPWPYAVAP